MRIDVNPQAQAAVGRTRAAQSAVERARAAEAAGDLAQAIGHYEHAQRLAPGDAEITLSIGMTLIRQGDARASALLEPVGQRDDVREAWLALAALHCARRDTEAAASALSQVLSRAALPADPGSFELAGRVVRMGGLPGWANLAANGTLRTWLATKRAPAGLAVRLDGRALRLAAPRDGVAGQLSLALPAGWQQAQSLDITHDGVALLGSPIAPWRLARASSRSAAT